MRAGRAFAQLQAANPVPVEAESPWRRSTIRIVLGLAALAVAFLLVAPAVGVRVPILDFWTAEKAPPKVVEDFESLAEGAPAGMDPQALPGETRKVPLAGGSTVWVAPTRAGGYCTEHGCDKLGTFPLGITWGASKLPARGHVPQPQITDFDILDGAVNSRYVDSVEIRFRDGEVDRPNVTWVSEPIHHGFFEYRVPAAHRLPGHEIIAVVGLDADDRVVVNEALPGSEELKQVPLDAIVSKRAERARIATKEGEAVIWEAPTRYDGRCAWLEHGGRVLRFLPCMPKGYDYGRLAVRFVSTPRDVLFVGWAIPRIASVEIFFADGSQKVVEPEDGFLLAELPAGNVVAGHEATTIIGRDSNGKAVPPSIDVGKAFAYAPCYGPLQGRSCG
jgi:hypothetical protein